ncbi:MAG: SidA/IucD/PvdA family monooxygenase [Pseudomonadota bacterium]
MRARRHVDVLGIGFGPSNIATAIALGELSSPPSMLFVERKPGFAWHPGMMFDDARMQVCFLKDLVTFRNPSSPFTFIRYLHERDRLCDFANLQNFFPTRVEFSDYFHWCASAHADLVQYGFEVQSISPARDDASAFDVEIVSATGALELIRADAIIHAGGLLPRLPKNVDAGPRIFHGYRSLEVIDPVECAGATFAVIGGGQSAAEIVNYLYHSVSAAKIYAVFSQFGYVPADDSPLVNQIFDPGTVDLYFSAPAAGRRRLSDMHAATNYGVADLDLIESLFADWYGDKVKGVERIVWKRLKKLRSAAAQEDAVTITLQSVLDGSCEELNVDYLVCATGFAPADVTDLFSPSLRKRVILDEAGAPCFSREYRLRFEPDAPASIYSYDMCEETHGLSSTLISNMAVRAGEVARDIGARRKSNRALLRQRA